MTRINGDQCYYGLTIIENDVIRLTKKPNNFLTNARRIAQQLSKRCPNKLGWDIHQHVPLITGRARAAQVHPPELCQTICEGFAMQLQTYQNKQILLANIEINTETPGGTLMKIIEESQEKCKTIEEDLEEQLERAWDDASGAQLDPNVVKLAREEEIDYVYNANRYNKVPISECYQSTREKTNLCALDRHQHGR